MQTLDGVNPRIWPIVQAHTRPGLITTEEFRQVMWNGSRARSSGIMIFTLHSLIDGPAKLEVMKESFQKEMIRSGKEKISKFEALPWSFIP
jgi:hypothetical protein